MKVKMLKTYHGYYRDKSVIVAEGLIVEGPLAEQIHQVQPTWCEVVKDEDEAPDEEAEQEVKEGQPVWNKPPADKMMVLEKPGVQQKSLREMSRSELVAAAHSAGVTGVYGKNMAELIEAIEALTG